LGSDQATLLIYHDKDSKDRCFDSLKAHFQGQNQHSNPLGQFYFFAQIDQDMVETNKCGSAAAPSFL